MAKILILAALLGALTPAEAAPPPIRIPLPTSNVSLDPTRIQDVSSLLIARQLNCQLVRMRGRDAVPEAASEVSFVSPTVLRVSLSTSAVFSDGTPVTARDVAATYVLLRSSRQVFRNVFSWISSVETVDERTVEFRLRQPHASFLKFLGAPTNAIFPASFIERAKKDPSLWRAPVGCGRYRLERWDAQARLIELQPVSAGRPLWFSLFGGGAPDTLAPYDIIDATFADALDDVPPGYREEGVFDPRQMYLALNVAVPPWDDRAERCALLSRVDRAPIVSAYHGRAEPATSFFPRGILGFASDWPTPQPAASAPRLDRKFRLAFLEVSVPPTRRAVYSDSLARAAGAEIAPTVVTDTKRFGQAFRETKSDALVFGLKSHYLDGYEFLLMEAEGPVNVTGYDDPALKRRITQSQQINDTSDRAQVYRSIAAEIRKQCLLLPLASMLQRRVLVRASLVLPGFGEVPINEYDLSQAR